MTRKRIIRGVALIVLLGLVGAIVGCAAELVEQAPETSNALTIRGRVIVDACHYDEATGECVPFYHHESSNLIVGIGKDWIEGQLGNSAATNATADWISLSSDASDPNGGAAWTTIPAEIDTAGGLDRAQGTYSDKGTGVWEIAKTFNADGTFTNVQLTGLQWGDIGTDNLMATNNFTAVTLNDGDALTVTWNLSVSGP